MAINQQSPVPDARATPEIERAMRQIDRLIPLVGAPVTVTTQRAVPNELDNWDLVAPAMLFSATSCLVSLRWLAEARTPRREEDAIVLLRRAATGSARTGSRPSGSLQVGKVRGGVDTVELGERGGAIAAGRALQDGIRLGFSYQRSRGARAVAAR
jgi:hypothetical protein